jgi:hypothetical protein
VDKRLKALKGCWFVNIQQVAIRGIPDRIGCINGKFFALELKVGKCAKRARLQIYIVNKIKSAGGFAEFVYPENLEEVLENLNGYAHST